AEIVERWRVQRIEDFRTIDRDRRDRAVALEEKVVEGHEKPARLERERIHQPAEDDRRGEKPCEHHAAESQLIARDGLRDHREDQRHEEREQREQYEMAPHHLRPTATSYASMTTSRFSRPATIRNALPYS